MDWAEFLAEIQKSGSFRSRQETEATAVAVLMAMAEVLPGPQLDALSVRVPPEAMVYLRRTGSEPDPLFDSHLFLGWVVSSIDATAVRDKTVGGLDLTASYSGEEAIRRSRCVFAAIKSRLDPDEQRELASALPEEVDEWFREA
jgi:uncharacterized protein (DUF2267 family)